MQHSMARDRTPFETEFGVGWIESRDGRVATISLPGVIQIRPPTRSDPAMAALADGLMAYFAGDGPLPDLEEAGRCGSTEWTNRVYREVGRIPYGGTRTYAGIAATTGRPRAARAVGAAMAANPLAPIIPCHRVVGSDRSLRGYAGGVDMKRYLLEMEAANG